MAREVLPCIWFPCVSRETCAEIFDPRVCAVTPCGSLLKSIASLVLLPIGAVAILSQTLDHWDTLHHEERHCGRAVQAFCGFFCDVSSHMFSAICGVLVHIFCAIFGNLPALSRSSHEAFLVSDVGDSAQYFRQGRCNVDAPERGYCREHHLHCDEHGYACQLCRSEDSVCHKQHCSNHCYGCDQHGYSCRVCRSKDSVCHKQYCSNHCYGCDQHGYSCRVCRSKDSVCHKPFCNKHCHDCALQNVEDEVVEAVKAAISTCRFAAFADGLAPRHKRPPKWLLDKITACAKSIWQQDFIRLELQGSARKGTNIKGSDFDYHIVTSGPVELSDMHRLRDALSAPGIEVQEHIIVALKLKLHYDYTTTGSHFVTLELVPPEGTYFPPHADISKADPYFIGNRPAQRAVRVLKYLFSHCKPRLKSCFLEDLVKMADGRAPWNRIQQQSQLIEVDDFDSGLLLFEKVITDLQRHPHCSADSVIDRHRHMDSAKLAAMAKLALKLL